MAFTNREEWRAWLEVHHSTEQEPGGSSVEKVHPIRICGLKKRTRKLCALDGSMEHFGLSTKKSMP